MQAAASIGFIYIKPLTFLHKSRAIQFFIILKKQYAGIVSCEALLVKQPV